MTTLKIHIYVIPNNFINFFLTYWAVTWMLSVRAGHCSGGLGLLADSSAVNGAATIMRKQTW
jgi:hypothetical protein